MKVLCLLYSDDSVPMPSDPDVLAGIQAAYSAFYDAVNDRGAFLAGDPVQGASTSKTVTVRDGATQSVDGPARPGGEQIIGFYELEVADMADGIALAAQIPAAQHGRVEVRPIRES